jgi:hypothetical protein
VLWLITRKLAGEYALYHGIATQTPIVSGMGRTSDSSCKLLRGRHIAAVNLTRNRSTAQPRRQKRLRHTYKKYLPEASTFDRSRRVGQKLTRTVGPFTKNQSQPIDFDVVVADDRLLCAGGAASQNGVYGIRRVDWRK